MELSEMIKIRDAVMARLTAFEIDLKPDDFLIRDGEITLDGMDPQEWADAMTMD
jgi:hypothetical protein